MWRDGFNFGARQCIDVKWARLQDAELGPGEVLLDLPFLAQQPRNWGMYRAGITPAPSRDFAFGATQAIGDREKTLAIACSICMACKLDVLVARTVWNEEDFHNLFASCSATLATDGSTDVTGHGVIADEGTCAGHFQE